MGIHSKIYIGHVETINPDGYNNEQLTESKVVALRLLGIDAINHLPKYQPLRKYGEYYKIQKIEPIGNSMFMSDNKINKVLKKTGKSEVRVLKKTA